VLSSQGSCIDTCDTKLLTAAQSRSDGACFPVYCFSPPSRSHSSHLSLHFASMDENSAASLRRAAVELSRRCIPRLTPRIFIRWDAGPEPKPNSQSASQFEIGTRTRWFSSWHGGPNAVAELSLERGVGYIDAQSLDAPFCRCTFLTRLAQRCGELRQQVSTVRDAGWGISRSTSDASQESPTSYLPMQTGIAPRGDTTRPMQLAICPDMPNQADTDAKLFFGKVETCMVC